MCGWPESIQYVQNECSDIFHYVHLIYIVYLKIVNIFRPHLDTWLQNRRFFETASATLVTYTEDMIHGKGTLFVKLRRQKSKTVTLMYTSIKSKVIYIRNFKVWDSLHMLVSRMKDSKASSFYGIYLADSCTPNWRLFLALLAVIIAFSLRLSRTRTYLVALWTKFCSNTQLSTFPLPWEPLQIC